MARFEAALKRVEAQGTTIVAFTPPFASEVIEAYTRNPVHYGFYRDALHKLEKIFQRNGWHFFDGSNLEDFGLDDRSMKDRDHAQETYHVALLLRMSAVPAVRQALEVNPEYLQALMSDPDTTPWYPDYSQKKS